MKQNEQDGSKVADFIGAIIELNRGNTVIECGRKIQELTESMIDTGGKGKFTLTLDFSPCGLKDGRVNQFEVRPEIKIVKPEHPQGKSTFFVTEEGKLTRQDPDQMDLELGVEEVSNGRRGN